MFSVLHTLLSVCVDGVYLPHCTAALQSLCMTLDQTLRPKTELYEQTGNYSLNCYRVTRDDLRSGLSGAPRARRVLLEQTLFPK